MVEIFDDGVAFTSAVFEVTTAGAEFLRGRQATVVVQDFPEPGKTAILEWQESTQSFVMTDVGDGGLGAGLPPGFDF